MKTEKSCGAVVYTAAEGEILYLIVRSRSGSYGFPKGHVEGDETETETALREVLEETGVNIRLVPGFREEDRYPLPQKPGTVKTVVYFLGVYEDQTPVCQEKELSAAKLCTYAEAEKLLRFRRTKRILALADAMIKNGRAPAGGRMSIDVSKLSSGYEVRRLSPEDVPAVYALASGNPQYYKYCPPFVTEESIISDMSALPPRKEMKDKYYLGYFDGEKLVAVLDLIAECPDKDTAFIGFFMTDASVQNAGVGSGIVSELMEYLTREGYSRVRLGRVRGNPQPERFWKKNGFCDTGLSYETDGYTVLLQERTL